MRISDWSSDVCSSDLAADADQVVGEKSADYLAHPEAARRIAQRLPEARLVVQLRNPIDRAYSDYCMFFRRGAVTPHPERYLRSEEHTSELQSLMRISYAVFCLKKKNTIHNTNRKISRRHILY